MHNPIQINREGIMRWHWPNWACKIKNYLHKRQQFQDVKQEVLKMSSGTQQGLFALASGDMIRFNQLIAFRDDIDLSSTELQRAANHLYQSACDANQTDTIEELLKWQPQLISNVDAHLMLDHLAVTGKTDAAKAIAMARPELLNEIGIAGTPIEAALLTKQIMTAAALSAILVEHGGNPCFHATLRAVRDKLISPDAAPIYETVTAKLHSVINNMDPQVTHEKNLSYGRFTQKIFSERDKSSSSPPLL